MRLTAAVRALWDLLWGASAPLAGPANTGREQFDREYDALLLETAASLEATRKARSNLRRVA